jgi:ADP-dependent NAD(P)H-hydrate dehydratase / NAD(P)H-hydrate epimerase
MAAVTICEMRALEAAALEAGWTEEQLMDLAGDQLAKAIAAFFPHPGTLVAYLGKGHNAGDALIALRVLRDRFGWKISLRPGFQKDDCAALTRKKWSELGGVETLEEPLEPSGCDFPLVLLDALLGIGSTGEIRSPLQALAEEMRQLRNTSGARIAAVDLPSGIDPDTGETFETSVTADVTFMIGAEKTGLLTEQAASHTGALSLVPVKPLTSITPAKRLIAPQNLNTGKAPRNFQFHKGNAGKVGILAGSEFYTGAAVLAATGALRAGAGLVTIHAPSSCIERISARCTPEIIVKPCDNPADLLQLKYDSLVIGCGLGNIGKSFGKGLLQLLSESDLPTVLDADALNFIAKKEKHSVFKKTHILTPHPKEFERLAPEFASLQREEAAQQFVKNHPVTLLLKGSRTLVAQHEAPLWVNSTGSPGMACGGQGDLLAGVIGALLAARIQPLEAAALGAWLCGRAAERALTKSTLSEESLTPSDGIANLGGAFLDWKTSRR